LFVQEDTRVGKSVKQSA